MVQWTIAPLSVSRTQLLPHFPHKLHRQQDVGGVGGGRGHQKCKRIRPDSWDAFIVSRAFHWQRRQPEEYTNTYATQRRCARRKPNRSWAIFVTICAARCCKYTRIMVSYACTVSAVTYPILLRVCDMCTSICSIPGPNTMHFYRQMRGVNAPSRRLCSFYVVLFNASAMFHASFWLLHNLF